MTAETAGRFFNAMRMTAGMLLAVFSPPETPSRFYRDFFIDIFFSQNKMAAFVRLCMNP